MNARLLSFLGLLALQTQLAHADTLQQFALTVGRAAGLGTVCQQPQQRMDAFMESTSRYARARWTHEGTERLIDTVRIAGYEAVLSNPPDQATCFNVQRDLMLGIVSPASLITGSNLSQRPQEDEVKAQKNEAYIRSVGAHICHYTQGSYTPTIAKTERGAVPGKSQWREFYVQGYTEAVNGNRVKVLVSSIRTVTEVGVEYLDNLQPHFTKGQYAWTELVMWRPCDR
jgi:hypothetical protein